MTEEERRRQLQAMAAGMAASSQANQRSAMLPRSPSEMITMRGGPDPSIAPQPPVNPVDRVRNAVSDSDWYRGMSPEGQKTVTGAMDVGEFLPPVAAARGAYDLGAGAASSHWGQAALGALGAVPEAGKMGSIALGLLPAAAKGGAKRGSAAAREAERGTSLATGAPTGTNDFLAASPAIVRPQEQAATDAIFRRAEEVRQPKYPPATQPVFRAGDDARASTIERVPQVSIRDQLPGPEPGRTAPLPGKNRAGIIQENAEGIADVIAGDLRNAPSATGKPRQFYHTGPVLQGLEDVAGISPEEAVRFMRDWSGQGAATSPRTATPQNLRNASYLQWRREMGQPLTSALRESEGNRPGFAMMGMHTDLGDAFARGSANPLTNPKPFTFRENWAGNQADVTSDTHNIRATLHVLDRMYPGELPRQWFKTDKAYDTYKQGGGFGKGPMPVGDISDTLVDEERKKIRSQVEYGVMTEPWYRAAKKLGIDPAEAQAQGWFHYGPLTGLRSPEATIPDLLNSQIEETARATGLHPEDILKMWGRRRIPLAGLDPGTRMG
jgi:hypothetical protein